MVHLGDCTIIIVAYYIPPTKSLSEDLFSNLDEQAFVIIGDLNAKINKRKPRNSIGNHLIELIERSTNSNIFYNYSPTFFKNKTISGKRALYEERLDHVVYSSSVLISDFKVLFKFLIMQ